MKFKCVKNKIPGWLWLDYSKEVDVGEECVVIFRYTSTILYSKKLNKWVYINSMDFEKMFVPVD